MKHIYKALFAAILLPITALAQTYEYRVENIPDSLKQDAVAVIRNYSAVYKQTDLNNATYTVSMVITILNDKGKSYAHFVSYKDDFTDLTKFEGIIRSNDGKEIKKIKKGDLTESSFSDQMATDSKSIYYEVNSPVYPYTVEYKYEQKIKKGIITYPEFRPLVGTSQSIEKGEYTIELPLDMDLRYYATFNNYKLEEKKTELQHIYTFSIEGIKAIEYESLAPPFRSYAPSISLAPNKFCYDDVCGNMQTWKDYGSWTYKLLEGRDALPTDIVNKAKELTKNAKTEREKVEILYKYLQDNSRYVSIQLGIGGLQPIVAESVVKNSYGDCKGLSNLMKALLKAVDIPSNYCAIYMGDKKDFLSDFSSVNQANHVILLVPIATDSIWLECTSQTLPFGYVHDDIAGHDALVMTDKGGVVCKLPSYTADDNRFESVMTMNINTDGSVDGKLTFTEKGLNYGDNYSTLRSNDREKHVAYITRHANLTNMKIGKISTSEDVSTNPTCSLRADFTASDVVNKTGTRIFVPIAPLDREAYDNFKSNKREQDILINHAFSESDSIIINLPEGYVIESLPKDILLPTKFGVFIAQTRKEGETKVIYKQRIEVFEGRYDKSDYADFKKFYQSITTASKRKLVAKEI